MDPLTVFIGSSSEACDRGIVPRLTSLLAKHDFKVLPWYDNDAFAPGEYTLDALLGVVREVDLAIFVFSKDDRVETRGRTEFVPRDNVLLEYGLFTSHLGRRRVAVIQEEGVKLPIDVNGMGVARFSGTDEPRRDATLEVSVNDLAKRWRVLDDPPPAGQLADAGLGFINTVTACHERLNCITRKLWVYDRSRGVPCCVRQSVGLLRQTLPSRKGWLTVVFRSVLSFLALAILGEWQSQYRVGMNCSAPFAVTRIQSGRRPRDQFLSKTKGKNRSAHAEAVGSGNSGASVPEILAG